MKRNIIIALVVMALVSAISWAAELSYDNRGTRIQGHAPNASKTISLGVGSQTVDMRNDISWQVYVPNDCKFRTMSTTTKTGLQKTIVGGGWMGRVVRSGSAFTNFSGCTSGELERQ